jgi:hypothetical protein
MAIVSYTLETLPKTSQEDWDRVDAIKDEDIDFSDIPRQDLSRYRPWRELHSEESVKNRKRFIADYQALKKATIQPPAENSENWRIVREMQAVVENDRELADV